MHASKETYLLDGIDTLWKLTDVGARLYDPVFDVVGDKLAVVATIITFSKAGP